MKTITPTPSSNFVQQLAILVTIAISIAVLPGIYRGDLFSFHPLLMSIGFLGFMSEGILAAHRLRHLNFTDGATRVAGLQNHMWIQFTSTVCITLGFYAIYRNKVSLQKESNEPVTAYQKSTLFFLLLYYYLTPPLPVSRHTPGHEWQAAFHFSSRQIRPPKLPPITSIPYTGYL